MEYITVTEAAKKWGVSVGTLNNNMRIIYQKLLINGKKELREHII